MKDVFFCSLCCPWLTCPSLLISTEAELLSLMAAVDVPDGNEMLNTFGPSRPLYQASHWLSQTDSATTDGWCRRC